MEGIDGVGSCESASKNAWTALTWAVSVGFQAGNQRQHVGVRMKSTLWQTNIAIENGHL